MTYFEEDDPACFECAVMTYDDVHAWCEQFFPYQIVRDNSRGIMTVDERKDLIDCLGDYVSFEEHDNVYGSPVTFTVRNAHARWTYLTARKTFYLKAETDLIRVKLMF